MAVLGAGCKPNALGACNSTRDCAPPASVCGPDGRCVPGCIHPDVCPAGASCDPGSGVCSGGVSVGSPCQSDSNCDPPDIVCDPQSSACAFGCTISGIACPAASVCSPLSGRCCAPGAPGCQGLDGGAGCSGDAECGAPVKICVGGVCLAGCAAGGAACANGQTCQPQTGRCAGGCATDADCDAGSYCTSGGTCAPVILVGAGPCAGGRPVTPTCARKTAAASFSSCAGAPGPAACPYCIDSSCATFGLCQSVADCHRGDACTGGLCQASGCAQTVAAAQVLGGMFSAGKEVCVHDLVSSAKSGYDGLIEIRLGAQAPYLYADVASMYQNVALPVAGQTITVHGTVRWDGGHADWELMPVDWIGP